MKLNNWALISALTALFLIFNYMFTTEVRITPNIKFPNNITANQGNKPITNAQEVPQITDIKAVTQVTLPVSWGNLGKKMVEDGVIDKTKFEQTMGSLSEEDKKLIEGNNNDQIVMTDKNSRLILNLLWAFGLANKNSVLEKGEIMQDPSQVSNYASTGGWTLSEGNSMGYFSKFSYVTLDSSQQQMVEEMSAGIYRPCCNNSTSFPDCNHGMAMLGLLELMAKNGVSKDEAYKVALQVNSIWFPQNYSDIALYFSESGTSINKVSAKEVLSAKYSSASGYRQTRSQIKSLPQSVQGGGGCGI